MYFEEEEVRTARCVIKNEKIVDFWGQLDPFELVSAELLQKAEDLAFDLELEVEELLAKFGATMGLTRAEEWRTRVRDRNAEVQRLGCGLHLGADEAEAKGEFQAGQGHCRDPGSG